MAPCRLARRREWEIGFHVRHASTDNLQFATVASLHLEPPHLQPRRHAASDDQREINHPNHWQVDAAAMHVLAKGMHHESAVD